MRTVAALALAATLATPALAETVVESANDFETTLSKLRTAIEASPASVIHEVDHAAGAQSAGLELEPTTLVIFGNPQVGTQLMQADHKIALALPMKMLVAEIDGTVRIVYTDPAELTDEYELGDAAELTGKMSGLVSKLAEAAAN